MFVFHSEFSSNIIDFSLKFFSRSDVAMAIENENELSIQFKDWKIYSTKIRFKWNWKIDIININVCSIPFWNGQRKKIFLKHTFFVFNIGMFAWTLVV